MAYVIKALGFNTVPDIPCNFVDHYLVWYDPDLPDPEATLAKFTPNIAQAMRFPDQPAAMCEWMRISRVHPVRPDGEPNRPLTAIRVEFVKAPDNMTNVVPFLCRKVG